MMAHHWQQTCSCRFHLVLLDDGGDLGALFGRKYSATKLNICGLSKGDIHENPTTIIHHGGGIAAGCWRRFGAREERRGTRACSGGTAERPGRKGSPGREARRAEGRYEKGP